MLVRICSLLPDFTKDATYITRLCGVVAAELAFNTMLPARDFIRALKVDTDRIELCLDQSVFPPEQQCSNDQIGRARAIGYGFNRGYETGKGK